MPRAAKPQISFADWELLQQGIALEPLLQSISDFLDEHEKIAEAVRRDPGTRSEKSRDRSQRVDSATGAALLDPHARQELELSRTA